MTFSSIGSSVLRQDVYAKVTGTALFTGDLRLPGCLTAKVLRSPYPHAKILGIDTSRARQLPGVRAVITAADLPDRFFGNGLEDQPVLARDRVRFIGERIAAVAAEDLETAAAAVKLIEVRYEELPAVTDPIEAMSPDAPLVHLDFSRYSQNSKVQGLPNVVDLVTFGIGNPDEGFAQADIVSEHTFRTQMVHHGYMETHVSMVEAGSDGKVKVYCNNKAPFFLRTKLASLLQLPEGMIEVNVLNIGGDFGGKGALMDEPLCYYLALASGRPVSMRMTVEEELTASNPRHATIITLKSGVLKDGTLVARSAKVIYDEGAYAQANAHPIVGGVRRALGAYRIPHTRLEGYAVYTNSVPGGHCRAPGDPQSFFAVESHTDMLAEAVGLDPVEFRRRNVLKAGDLSPIGLKWQGINALDVLELTAAKAEWQKPKSSANVGYGIALAERYVGQGVSAAVVMLHADSSATVVTGSTDPGTGSNTVMRQIAAEELQLPVDNVYFSTSGTSSVPYDTGSGSSRVTHTTGQAVRLAAQDALQQVKKLAAAQWQVEAGQITYMDGTFSAPGWEGVPLEHVLAKAGRANNVILGRGSYISDDPTVVCFYAQAVEVEVDPETGQVTVNRVVAVNDIGKAINPASAKAQVEGSVVQGMGYALSEEIPLSGGRPKVHSLAEYLMSTALDAPQVESHLLEQGGGPGPYGAKAIGEHAVAVVAPAIANAIFDAVGVRLTELPMSPEKVRQALRAKEDCSVL